MVLERDDARKVRVVALEPGTDAVLGQSGDIAVKLGV